MVLEATTPVGRHARVGLGENRHQVLEFVRRHRGTHANIVDLGHGNHQPHFTDDRFEDEVVLSLAGVQRILLADRDDLARTVLGIDDRVTLLELHANLASSPSTPETAVFGQTEIVRPEGEEWTNE